MQIYSIIDAYNYCQESYSSSHCQKYNCRCNHVIYKINDDTSIYVDESLKQMIIDHHSTTLHFDEIYEKYQRHILTEYGIENIIYNVWHKINFSIGIFDFSYKLTAIGYSENSVIYFIVAPQYNKLNHESILIKEILLNYAILNSEFGSKNYDRYINKKIYSCIFTLDLETPIFHELNIEKGNENILLVLKKYLFHRYAEYNENIYKFYLFCKNDIRKPTNVSSVEYTIEKINNLINQQKAISKGYSKMPQYILKFFENINSQIKFGCNGDKYAIKNIMNNFFGSFENFNSSMNTFLYDEIYGKEISSEIVDY